MENFVAPLAPVVLSLVMLRLLALPIRLGWKLLCNTFFGLVCLFLLNAAAPVTGLAFPINAVTALVAGTLGLPGIGLIALLELM